MSGMTTSNMQHLIRSDLWSSELKTILEDEMLAQQYVRILTDLPDGDTLHIPSIGQMTVDNYVEETEIQMRPLDTGEFTFTIDQYLSSGTTITEKAMQDSFYSQQLIAGVVPKMERALMKHFEATTLASPEVGVVANSNNLIDGRKHRFAASGTDAKIALEDFARARHILKKANVPDTNLVAIVDPSVEYTINTLSNLVQVSSNPHFEGIVSSGIASGMRFVKNVYGFDVYTSNNLADIKDSALQVGGATTTASFATNTGKANLFFSAAGGDVNPFVGAWRQAPKVDYEWQPSRQRHAYMMTARYGVKHYRPENTVVIASRTDV